MSHSYRFFALLTCLLAIGCAGATRSPFAPVNASPTVGMPAELNERERLFVADIEGALQEHGLIPVRHGAGELSLEFTMDAGPINTNTKIALLEGRRNVARGNGRAAGVPLVGRSGVAETSFSRAFEDFQDNLERAAERRNWNLQGTRPTGAPAVDLR